MEIAAEVLLTNNMRQVRYSSSRGEYYVKELPQL
jgi:hypothetical protein